MEQGTQVPDGTIETARLRLVPLTIPALEALIDRDSSAAESMLDVRLPVDLVDRSEALLRLRLADMRVRPDAWAWYLRAIALQSEEHRFVGLAGFHGPPDIGGSVEVGYEIEPDDRRNGYATEAAGSLVDWAFGQPGLRCVNAAVRADNEPSLGVVRRLGFRPAGSRWDAVEGMALLFERRR
jgi:RimJ/RimL family protein N-acetyltransferase